MTDYTHLHHFIQISHFLGNQKRIEKTNEPQWHHFEKDVPKNGLKCWEFIGHIEELDNRLFFRRKILNQLLLPFGTRRRNVVTLLRR